VQPLAVSRVNIVAKSNKFLTAIDVSMRPEGAKFARETKGQTPKRASKADRTRPYQPVGRSDVHLARLVRVRPNVEWSEKVPLVLKNNVWR